MPVSQIHERRRKDLIEAAWRVIARVGVDNATVRDIARAAGCTTGSLLHHFQNRDELIGETADQLAAEFFQEAAHEWRRAPPGVARLRALIGRLAPTGLRQRDRTLALFRLWSGASAHAPTARALRRHYLRLHELAVGFIEEAIDNGELVAQLDTARLADVLIALGDGVSVSRVLELGRTTVDLDAAVDVVLRGFQSTGEKLGC